MLSIPIEDVRVMALRYLQETSENYAAFIANFASVTCRKSLAGRKFVCRGEAIWSDFRSGIGHYWGVRRKS